MGSVELNSSGSSPDKKLNKSCLHLPLPRGSGKVCLPSACLVVFVCFICLFFIILSFWKAVCMQHVTNCWGASFETWRNDTNCMPGRGVTLLLHRCSSRKISAIHALRRGFVLLFWNPEFPVAGLGIHIRGLLLGMVGESWTGPWMDSSEESLNLVLGLWWAGSWISNYTVLPGVPGSISLLLGWWLSTYTFQFFPQCAFYASYIKT